jgi:sulfonate transport system ATP-binding protein
VASQPQTTWSTPRPEPVELEDLRRSFPRPRVELGETSDLVLRDISLRVDPGEIVAVLGASGCGKSTLLRIVAGLDLPSAGTVRIGSSRVVGSDPRCAVAFQEPRLLPWRTLAENIKLGLRSDRHRQDGADAVTELLALVGLTGFADHRPREVSGGMAQRAALARALARRPSVLLLDEPFGSLDALTRLRMQDLLLDIHAAAPTTVVLVTHDVDEALYLADRVVVLGSEEGRAGSTVISEIRVSQPQPRDRGAAVLARLRVALLADLGIGRHAPTH